MACTVNAKVAKEFFFEKKVSSAPECGNISSYSVYFPSSFYFGFRADCGEPIRRLRRQPSIKKRHHLASTPCLSPAWLLNFALLDVAF